MEIIIIDFLKEILLWAIWSFWNRNAMASCWLWICPQVFLLILHNKKEQEAHENFISCFFEKKSHLGQFDLFRSYFNVWVDVVKIEPDHCYYWNFKRSGMVKIRKQSRHDFSVKRLCGGYCIPFFHKRSFFDPCPENCLSFSRKLPQKIV